MNYSVVEEIKNKMGDECNPEFVQMVIGYKTIGDFRYKPGCVNKKNDYEFTIELKNEKDKEFIVRGFKDVIEFWLITSREIPIGDRRPRMNYCRITDNGDYYFNGYNDAGFYYGNKEEYAFYDREACETCINQGKFVSENEMKVLGIKPDRIVDIKDYNGIERLGFYMNALEIPEMSITKEKSL